MKCEKCGKSYRRQKDKYANGDEKIYYYCSTPSSKCKNSTIHLSVLENLISEELKLDSFDSKIMIDKLSKIGINDNVVYFYYKDGKITNREYSNPIRPKPKHSEKNNRENR
ncbi:zinc ribbon domain-containing protein [Campylobacter hominis]|uniref:zinc ribbon domain-containing protein n=1 Tax=Campylobacter hominis TaxID=76517 RepID=UPI003CCFF386